MKVFKVDFDTGPCDTLKAFTMSDDTVAFIGHIQTYFQLNWHKPVDIQ